MKEYQLVKLSRNQFLFKLIELKVLMAQNSNSSGWIEEGRKIGLDLSSLEQDKSKIFEKIESLGLPHYQYFFVKPEEFDSERTKKLLQNPSYFCRLIPHQERAPRPYKSNVKSMEELKEFCEGYDRSQYSIMLVKVGNVTHTGAIIATDDTPCVPGKAVIELVEGTGEDLFHGRKTPITAMIGAPPNFSRIIRYDTSNPSEEEKRLIFRAIKLVGGPAHPFPGYFEFDVCDRRRIVFRNYQDPKSAYARI